MKLIIPVSILVIAIGLMMGCQPKNRQPTPDPPRTDTAIPADTGTQPLDEDSQVPMNPTDPAAENSSTRDLDGRRTNETMPMDGGHDLDAEEEGLEENETGLVPRKPGKTNDPTPDSHDDYDPNDPNDPRAPGTPDPRQK